MHSFATFVLLYVCSEMIIFLNKKGAKDSAIKDLKGTQTHIWLPPKGVVRLHVD